LGDPEPASSSPENRQVVTVGKLFRIFVVVCTLTSAAAAWAQVSDIETIRARYVATLINDQNTDQINGYVCDLREDGSWPDIDYNDKDHANWDLYKHVRRLFAMAQAYRQPDGELKGNAELRAAIIRGLEHWVAKGYNNGNWFSNVIAVPRPVAQTLLLMGDDLPQDLGKEAIQKVVSKAKGGGLSGQNIVWVAEIAFVRGLYEGNQGTLKRARKAILGQIRVTTREGVQPDWSYHLHGPLQQWGSYGLAFAGTVMRWAKLLQGTSLAINGDEMDLLHNYMLEGLTWVTWRGRLDLSACGRRLRENVQLDKGHAILNRLQWMYEIDEAHRATYEARLADNKADAANTLVGNKHFWRSDISVHRQPDWYASVKMSSNRVRATESINGANLQGLHLGDGALYVHRTGDEYGNILPVWDWHRLPGTTSDQSIRTLLPSKRNDQPPVDFVGGVSDGATGVAAFDFRRDALSARKAWFFEGDRIVCVGAGITATEGGPILTSVQQSLLQGPVVGSDGKFPPGSRELKAGAWVHHAGIGYQVLDAAKPVLHISQQTGTWKSVGKASGNAKPLTMDVFSLWLDHGTKPAGQTYAYVMFPAATAADMRRLSRASDVSILSNTPDRQAISRGNGDQVRAVFYSPGVLDLGKGRALAADGPCLVTLDRGRKQLFVAEPTQKLEALQLTIDGRTARVTLPAGGDAGRSVSVSWPVE
jgi:chondroitin AC lyase